MTHIYIVEKNGSGRMVYSTLEALRLAGVWGGYDAEVERVMGIDTSPPVDALCALLQAKNAAGDGPIAPVAFGSMQIWQFRDTSEYRQRREAGDAVPQRVQSRWGWL